MGIFRKINFGFVLTVIILISLSVYLINLEFSRKEEKIKIKEVCEKYLEFSSKYEILPEEYRTVKRSISNEDLENYKNEIEENFKKLSIDNSNIISINVDFINKKLDDEITGKYVTTKKNRKIKSTPKYVFKDNQVTVTFDDELDIEYKSIESPVWDNEKKEYSGEVKEEKKVTTIKDSIVLQKENDQWKVVYVNLGEYNEESNNGYVSVNTVAY